MPRYVFKLDGDDVCSLNLESLRLNLRAGGPDTLEWSYAADPTGTAPHAIHDLVTLACDTLSDAGVVTATTTLFYGRVTRGPAADQGSSAGWTFTAENAWGDLKRITMTQSWSSWDPVGEEIDTIEVPRVVLGQADDGSYQTTGETITEILTLAGTKGSTLTLGTIDTGVYVPPTELTDTSCDAALRQILAYHPDWVVWSEGTAIHARVPSALSTIAVGTPCATGLTIEHDPQTDEIPGGVVIVWERLHEADGSQKVERIHQTAGPLSGWPPPLYMTIPLAGTSTTTKQQLIETRTIPASDDLGETYAKLFYKGLVPAIKDAANGDIVIDSQLIAFNDPKIDELDDDGETVNPNARPLDTTGESTEDYPRQLVNGQVQPWFPDSIKQWHAIILANIRYTGTDPEIQRAVGGILEVSEPIIITNALPKTYRVLDDITEAEAPIEGLATAYWNAINSTRNEGTVSGDLRGTYLDLRPGRKLTVSGYFATASVIRETSIDCLTGTFTAAFGSSEYLNPKTIVDLARAMAKNKPTWKRPKERTEAEAHGGAGPIKEGSTQANQFATPYRKPPLPWDLIVTDPDTASVRVRPGTIITDPADLSTTLTITGIGTPVTVASGNLMWIEITGSDPLTATIEKGSPGTDAAWTTTGSADTTEFDVYRYYLWQFSSTDGGEEWQKVNDTLFARRLAEPTNFVVENVVFLSTGNRPVVVPRLKGSHRAIP